VRGKEGREGVISLLKSFRTNQSHILENMIDKQNKKSNYGFTLIEGLVAASLFVIAITASTGLFVTYTNTQRESGIRQRALTQLSFDLERMAQDIRLKKVVFSKTSVPYRNPSAALYSTDGEADIVGKEIELGVGTTGAEEYYFFVPTDTSPGACSGFFKKGLYKHTTADSNACEQIFAIDGVSITDVGFYISPSYNPYPTSNTDCKDSNVFNGYYCECPGNAGAQCHSGICKESLCLVSQPIVTISITAQIGGNAANLLVVQTSISSRQYSN